MVAYADAIFGEEDGVIVEHGVGVQVDCLCHERVGHVAHREKDIAVHVCENEEDLLVIELEVLGELHVALRAGSVESEVLHHEDLLVVGLRSESNLARKAFHLLVELRAVVAGAGTEHTSTMIEQRRVEVTAAGAAAAFLASHLAGGVRHLAAFFALVGSLALVAEVLFDVEIKGVLSIAFAQIASEHFIIESDFASCIFAFDVINCYFHYFSTKTIEPLAPGTEPLIINKLCSGITLITWRFWTVTRSLPICPAMRSPLNTFAG